MTSIYQAVSKYVYDEPYHKVGGAWWFIQMWFFAYFLELSEREHTFYKTLGLHVAHSLHTMPFDDHMSFFLGLVDWALVHLYLRLNSIYISQLGIRFWPHLNHIYRTLRVLWPLLVSLVEYLFQEVALPFYP